MRQTILNDIITAMKAKDKTTLSVLRMVKGAIQLEEINTKKELNDEEVIQILGKQIKTRKESMNEFEKAGRQDLVDGLVIELEILEKYMPEQMSEEEIVSKLENIFEIVKPTSSSDMGKIMKEAMPIFKGKADMSLVNKIIKEKLSK